MDLTDLTAVRLAALVAQGEVSAREVALAALARINAVNPALNAIVAPCEDEALAAADAVDAARARGEAAGPLAGVPVTVKVNVDQIGHATTNGLRQNAGLVADSDSPVVANLRKAGAVIVGRTNTPAFSLRWFTRNSLHGATLNPRAAGLTPGGSSGGAGSAVAAGMCAIGHGTDIAGSIRYPAYACGVHGLRPSLGRVPAYNATGADRLIGGQLMAVSGPLARSVPDLRLALAAMAAPDPRDPWFIAAPPEGPPLPRRVALCMAPDGMAVAPAVQAALLAAAERLTAAGYGVDEVATPPWAEAMAVQLRLWMADMRHGAAQAVQREADPDALFVYDCLCRIVPPLTAEVLMETLQARARLTRLWRGFLADWPLVLCPVSGEPPFPDHLDVLSESAFQQVLAAQMPQIAPPLMGLPGLAVTTDLTGPTPMGVHLLADWHREDVLLAAGEVLGAVVPRA
ncbi:amidase [Paragemmobacter straminiformis]|uniref:Amidase n=1 Tax=Paragemmobacter straminiformis TaxID=2045119 RepID=A0A842IAG7_9RHOB|nr:amidase [Gemmobacter straminiformis]MBC2836589.1 amidase [Gemmobacter straminiformis]